MGDFTIFISTKNIGSVPKSGRARARAARVVPAALVEMGIGGLHTCRRHACVQACSEPLFGCRPTGQGVGGGYTCNRQGPN